MHYKVIKAAADCSIAEGEPLLLNEKKITIKIKSLGLCDHCTEPNKAEDL